MKNLTKVYEPPSHSVRRICVSLVKILRHVFSQLHRPDSNDKKLFGRIFSTGNRPPTLEPKTRYKMVRN